MQLRPIGAAVIAVIVPATGSNEKKPEPSPIEIVPTHSAIDTRPSMDWIVPQSFVVASS